MEIDVERMFVVCNVGVAAGFYFIRFVRWCGRCVELIVVGRKGR
jgi:hypothetical protein